MDIKVSKRSRGSKDNGIELDAGVWGQLQHHIQLEDVYQKLPFEELFRLRVVCKAWNHAAKQRLEPKPFFVIIPEGAHEYGDTEYLNGVLCYDVASKKYSFKRQRFPIPYTKTAPFEVEGLIFCDHPDYLKQQGVFNIHNKTWHAVPPAPKKSEYRSAIGMMVDTSKRPYSFKLVVGSLDTKTQIYDSQSQLWTTTSSRLKQFAKPALERRQIVNCMCHNGCVYISVGSEILLMYSMERDTWTIMDFPEVKGSGEDGCDVHTLGVWEGRIFTTREDCSNGNVTVWELVDPIREEWAKYVVISGANYSMLNECDFFNHGPSGYEDLRVYPCFCNGYLLLYNWHYTDCRSYAMGMLNLATHEWEKIHFPSWTVAFQEVVEEDSDMDEYFEAEEEDSDIEGGREKSREYFNEVFAVEKDSEEDEDTESEDSQPVCAPQAVRIRRKPWPTKVNFQRKKGKDTVLAKIAHSLPAVDCEFQLAMVQDAQKLPSTVGNNIIRKPNLPDAQKLPSTVENIVRKPNLPVTLAAKVGNLSATIGKMVVKPPLAPKVAKPSPEIVFKPKFECAMCFFESDCPDKYEAHKKTKVHGIVEELWKRKKPKYPLVMLNDYISHTGHLLEVNYERKTGEVIAIVGPRASRGAVGPHVKGFGAIVPHSKKKSPKQMAAADALERIIENDSESRFAKFLHKIAGVVNWTAFLGDRNDGRSIGVHGGKEGNLASNDVNGIGNLDGSVGSSKGVGEELGGNSGGNVGSSKGVGEELGGKFGGNVGSNKGVGEELGGNSGGNVGSSKGVGEELGGNSSGNVGSNKGVGEELGGKFGGNVGSNKGVGEELGGNSGGNVGSSKGVGEELGGNSSGNVGSNKGVGEELGGKFGGNVGSNKGVGEELGGKFGGNVGSSKGVREELGRGRRGGGYGGRESFGGAVRVGGNSYGFQDVDGIGYVGWEPASHALSHGNGGLHSKYGHQSQGSLAPYNAGQTQYVQTQHVLHTQYVQTQHVLHTPWISTVGGPVPGRTPYSTYDMAPQSTGVSTGMRQTTPHAYNHQFTNYAPPPINYSAYGAYVVNTDVPVEEMAPGTSNSTHSALVAQYGVMQPQQYVSGYSLQGATQHQQP